MSIELSIVEIQAPILVATDLSPAADDAICEADRRARALDAPLAVCLALPDPAPSAPLFPPVHQAVDVALPALRERAMVALGTRVAALTGRTTAELQIDILIGTPHVEIVELAERLGAQLLVVGSHGASGLTHALLGNVAERVMRHAPCPVLVTRPSHGSDRILVATDFSPAAETAVAVAVSEARRDARPLTIFHSVQVMPVPVALDAGQTFAFPLEPTPPDVLARLDQDVCVQLIECLDGYGLDGDCMVLHGPAIATIVETARTIDADLIVVGTIGRSGLKRFLVGSVAEGVVRQAPCSVLVVPPDRGGDG